jgi:hypothetical protein
VDVVVVKSSFDDDLILNVVAVMAVLVVAGIHDGESPNETSNNTSNDDVNRRLKRFILIIDFIIIQPKRVVVVFFVVAMSRDLEDIYMIKLSMQSMVFSSNG